MGVAERLMRVGTQRGELGPVLLAYEGRLRTDVVRFGAGCAVQSKVSARGASIEVEIVGRDARLVAVRLQRRVVAPLSAVIEDVERGRIILRITEASHADR